MAKTIFSSLEQGSLERERKRQFWKKYNDPKTPQSEIMSERRKTEQREIRKGL